MPNSLSVVVRASHSTTPGEPLRHVLCGLARQAGVAFEVIVVDDATRGTQPPEIEAEWRSRFARLVLVQAPRPNAPSECKNLGVACSDGDVIAFLDGDTILCSDHALEEIAAASEQADFGFGANRYWTYPPRYFERHAPEYLRRIEAGSYHWMLDGSRAFRPVGIKRESGFRDLLDFTFIGNCGYVRRDLFETVGRFDSAYGSGGWEDDDLSLRLYMAAPDRFGLLAGRVNVLHVNHPVDGCGQIQRRSTNRLLYNRRLTGAGLSSFNINVLMGVPDYPGEPVVEPIQF